MVEMAATPSRPPIPGARFCAVLSAPVRRMETMVWLALAIALIFLRLAVTGGPAVSNDSYQYMSIAGNFAQGEPGYTSIIHFDTERSHRVVPAPMTNLQSGYPVVIAALETTGLTPERAGLVISAAAILSLLFLYRAVGKAFGLGGLATRFLIIATITSAAICDFSTQVISDGLFTSLSTSAVLLFVVGISGETRRGRTFLLLVSANVLVGLAYWVRYAGLFLFLAMGCSVIWLGLRKQYRTAVRAGLCMLISTGIIALGFVRNLLLVHTWRGGNDKVVHHPLPGVVGNFASAVLRLLTGNGVSARLAPLDLIMLLAIALIAFAALKTCFEDHPPLSRTRAFMLEFGLGFIILYCGAILYLGHTSVIAPGVRVLFPLLPIGLIIFAIIISWLQEHLEARRHVFLVATLAIMTCAYVGLNVLGILEKYPPSLDQTVRATLAEEVAPGRTVNAWIADHIQPDDVIVANRGQATGYVLNRPTISLISREYTDQRWDEPTLKSLIGAYHAKFLILYPGDNPDLFNSPFLANLLAGASPSWLTPEVRQRDVKIYRVKP